MSFIIFVLAYFLWVSLFANLFTLIDARGENSQSDKVENEHLKNEVKRLTIRLLGFAVLSLMANEVHTNAVYWAGATVAVGFFIGYYSLRLVIKLGFVTAVTESESR